MIQYIYIFEDGTMGQSEYPPTETDLELMDSGCLNVLTIDYDKEGIYYQDGCDMEEARLMDEGFHTL